MTKISKIIALTLLALSSGCTAHDRRPAQAVTSSTQKQVHEALFDNWFPIQELPEAHPLRAAVLQVREKLFAYFSQSPDKRETFDVLAQMGFVGLDATKRAEFLYAMETQMPGRVRATLRELHATYTLATYGQLGAAISGQGTPRPILAANADFQAAALKSRLPGNKAHYDTAKHMLLSGNQPFDYLIIGSGPAGSLLAHELIQAGKTVALVEKGPFAAPAAVNTREHSEFRDNGGIRASADGAIFFRNGNALGGGASINIDLAFGPTLPQIQYRIDGWKREGRIPQTQFTPTEIRAAYEWVKKAVGTRTPPMSEVNANNRILWDGARAEGRQPSLYDLNTYAPGKSPSSVNDKRDPVSAFLLPAMMNTANPLVVLSETRVNKIVMKGDKAAGVEAQLLEPAKLPGLIHDPSRIAGLSPGAKFGIAARRVIVSAGSFGTPAVLLNSGFNNPNIGAGAIGHPSMPVIGVFDREIRPWEGTDATVYVGDRATSDGYILESMSADAAYLAMMTPGSAKEVFDQVSQFSRIGGFGVMLIDSVQDRNRVALDPQEGTPFIDYRLSLEDRQRFAKAVAAAVRIMFKAGAKKVVLPTNEPILTGTDAQGIPSGQYLTDISQAALIEKNLKFITNRTTITSAHLQATCKMGSSPSNSVVGPDHRVWGTQNVYVMDSSIFPTSIGANPMQSIYTFSKLLADRLAKE